MRTTAASDMEIFRILSKSSSSVTYHDLLVTRVGTLRRGPAISMRIVGGASYLQKAANSAPVSKVTINQLRKPYAARTALGKKLVALREKAIANGVQLLTAEEIQRELKHRFGEDIDA
jgi:hypothetical protein